MANFFRCTMTSPSASIPAGQDTITLGFTVGAMINDGTPDPTFSGEVHILKQADPSDDTYALISAAGEWGQPHIVLQGGNGAGTATFKVFKTYAPGPWIDLAVKAVSADGSVAGGSKNWTRVNLPPNLGPITNHTVRLSKNGVTGFQAVVPDLKGILLEIDGVGVWAPPVSPFGTMTGQW